VEPLVKIIYSRESLLITKSYLLYIYIYIPSAQNRQKQSLKECVLVKSVLKLQCHIVKNTLRLQTKNTLRLQTAFSAILPTGL